MAGNDADDGIHKDLNECVSQEQLQAVLDRAREEMTEAVDKAVTDGINRLNLGTQIERMDRRISTMTDTVNTLADVVTRLTGKVTEVENRVTTHEDDTGSNAGGNRHDDLVYDVNGDIDDAATRARRLHRRL